MEKENYNNSSTTPRSRPQVWSDLVGKPTKYNEILKEGILQEIKTVSALLTSIYETVRDTLALPYKLMQLVFLAGASSDALKVGGIDDEETSSITMKYNLAIYGYTKEIRQAAKKAEKESGKIQWGSLHDCFDLKSTDSQVLPMMRGATKLALCFSYITSGKGSKKVIGQVATGTAEEAKALALRVGISSDNIGKAVVPMNDFLKSKEYTLENLDTLISEWSQGVGRYAKETEETEGENETSETEEVELTPELFMSEIATAVEPIMKKHFGTATPALTKWESNPRWDGQGIGDDEVSEFLQTCRMLSCFNHSQNEKAKRTGTEG